jgi:hypothetical protein
MKNIFPNYTPDIFANASISATKSWWTNILWAYQSSTENNVFGIGSKSNYEMKVWIACL